MLVQRSARSGYKFTGKQRDTESNLDYFGVRYYNSVMARWTIPDWSGVPVTVPYANFGNPQTLNAYAYVQNNPVTLLDLDGHAPQPNGNDSTTNCGSDGNCHIFVEDQAANVDALSSHLSATAAEKIWPMPAFASLATA